ncbi:hypothetical protein ABIF29_009470 [Bradyrhizobium elkanii]|uniref:Uncharacterized protein n=1 Tax=Bradyrhizobium elkanii TaxID=29448 RepID=A0ABV4FHA3_BRAEL|nr:hypothetical protein [Bradyrhizobium elkanii]MCW2188898.1 hypothetical protein [Bradyrhizobium elkanii]
MSTYVTGFTRDAKSQNVIEFASDLAPDTWISIPRGLIADSARCRPPFRNDLAHRSDLMSPTIPR